MFLRLEASDWLFTTIVDRLIASIMLPHHKITKQDGWLITIQ